MAATEKKLHGTFWLAGRLLLGSKVEGKKERSQHSTTCRVFKVDMCVVKPTEEVLIYIFACVFMNVCIKAAD